MTVMQTTVGDKTYDISWEHPWRQMDFRGEQKTIKVTNCAIGLNLGTDPETEKTKYRWLGQGCAKWPIESLNPDAENPGQVSRLLLKGEKLSRDNARRISLTRALQAAKLDKKIRTIIWENYFRTFKSVRVIPPMPPPSAATEVSAAVVTNPYIFPITPTHLMEGNGGHRVASKVVSHVRFMAPASNWIH